MMVEHRPTVQQIIENRVFIFSLLPEAGRRAQLHVAKKSEQKSFDEGAESERAFCAQCHVFNQ